MMSSSDKNNSDYKMENILSSGKDLSESTEQSTNFTIQNNAGEIVSINVNRKETVENLQAIIQNQFGIPLNEQIFSCFGESTFSNINDGMQQTVNDLNEIRVTVNEIKDGFKDESNKAQQRINELEVKIAEYETKNDCEVNDESNAQLVEQKDLAQQSETEVCQISNRIIELRNENAELIDQSRICTIKDVVVNGEIDYELLNGKILVVDELRYSGKDGKWFVDKIGISFKNSDFLVYPYYQLCVDSHSNLSTNIINRIYNLGALFLLHVTITYSDYKKLLAKSPKLVCLSLSLVNVMDENAKKVEIDKLFKETKNVEKFYYKFKDGEVTSETAQKLAVLPPFPKLHFFHLHNVQESFDLKIFGECLKKNQTIEYCELWYKCSNKFFEGIKRARKDLLPTLPSTCKFNVKML